MKQSQKLLKGMIVHINSDNKEWGRIASNATVLENAGVYTKKVLVNVHSIMADLYMNKSDMAHIVVDLPTDT